jgi:hypothetical protein
MGHFSNSNFPSLAFEFQIGKKVRISLQFIWEKPRWTRGGSNLRRVRIGRGRICEGGTVPDCRVVSTAPCLELAKHLACIAPSHPLYRVASQFSPSLLRHSQLSHTRATNIIRSHSPYFSAIELSRMDEKCGLFRHDAYSVSRSLKRFDTLAITRPFNMPSGTGPYILESTESSLLSPCSQTCPVGTFTDHPIELVEGISSPP